MIVVIADDFTGAAELAGIGLRYGLKVEIQLDRALLSDADLLVIDTATRTMPLDKAFMVTREIAFQIRKLSPEWVYKKTDSVLRGHIITELKAIRDIFEKRPVVFLPANPGLARVIVDGDYYVRGRPLHQTDFGNDPEYDVPNPLTTSAVLDLLGTAKSDDIRLVKQYCTFPGILVGEISAREQLTEWAARLDSHAIPAGAAEFFEAILQTRIGNHSSANVANPYIHSKNMIVVCGSHSEGSHRFVARYEQSGSAICRIPRRLDDSGELNDGHLSDCLAIVLSQYQKHKKVLVTVGEPVSRGMSHKLRFIDLISGLVESVLEAVTIDELIIEGGSTSSAILRRLKWNRMVPLQELAPGVVRMKVLGEKTHYLTVKPGSYDWPASILETLT